MCGCRVAAAQQIPQGGCPSVPPQNRLLVPLGRGHLQTAAPGSVQAGLAGNGAHSRRRRIHHRGQPQLVSGPAVVCALPVQHRPGPAIPRQVRTLQGRLRRPDDARNRPDPRLPGIRRRRGGLPRRRRRHQQGRMRRLLPRGTLTRDPDMWPMQGKTGAARVALLTKAPVIPVAQWGANEVMPPYAKEKKLRLFPRKTCGSRRARRST